MLFPVNRETRKLIAVIRDLLFLIAVNCAQDPPPFLVTSFRLHFITVTYIPLLVKILFMIFLISWKSGRKSGLSSQHCFISSRSSSTPVISSDTVGRKGGNSPFCTLSTISIRCNSSRNGLAFVYPNQCSL